MHRRYLLSLILFVLAFATANAQSLRINVIDKDSKQPVFLAYINIYGANGSLENTVQTDEMGIADVTPKKYPCKIEIVTAGYESSQKEFTSAPVNTYLTVRVAKKFSSLNEVVVTGVAQPQRLKDALSNYQVVSRAAIQAQGAVTLDEAIKNQLNIKVSNDGVLGTSLSMQGLAANKVKILLDGLPLNGREGGAINLSQINMNNVERIEMVQGPMSVQYGTDAIGGVINIITRKDTKPFGINANAFYESNGKYNVDGNVTFNAAKKHQFTVGGGRNFFQGAVPLYTIVDTTAEGDILVSSRKRYFMQDEQYIGNFAYSYSAASGFKLTLAADYLDDKITDRQNIKSWSGFGAYAFNEYYHTKRYMNRLTMDGKLGKKGRWQSQNSFNVYDRTRNRYRIDMTDLSESLTTGTGDQDTTLFSDLHLRGSYSNALRKISINTGYDVNFENASSLKVAGKTKNIQDYAVFATASVPLLKDKMTIQAGGRVSYNTSYKAPITPSLNILYTPIEKLQVRASYTKGFRAPALKELYLAFIDDNHYLIGSEDLTAEQSHHGQLSASYQFYEKQANYIQLIATGYYNDVYNGIVLINMHPEISANREYRYGNSTRQKNLIASLQLDGQVKDLHFALGFANNYYLPVVNSYSSYSTQDVTTSLQYSWRKTGIGFNVFYKFTPAQKRVLVNIDGHFYQDGMLSRNHNCDISLDKKIWQKRIHLTAGFKNIFDIKVIQVSGASGASGASAHGAGGGNGVIPLMPRSFFTTLRLNID